jgi:thioredoxin reductase
MRRYVVVTDSSRHFDAAVVGGSAGAIIAAFPAKRSDRRVLSCSDHDSDPPNDMRLCLLNNVKFDKYWL